MLLDSLAAAVPPAPSRCFPALPRARRAAPSHPLAAHFSREKKPQSALRKLVPLADRVLVKRIELQAKSAGGILLPDSGKKLNEGEVVAVGPGALGKDGKRSPISVAIGDRVLLPEYGGHTVKVGEDECVCPGLRPPPPPPCPAPAPLLLTHLFIPRFPARRLFLYRDEDILGKFQ